jgi:hypothetical protein
MSRRRLAALAVAAVLVALFGGRWLALRYTEHAWFADLGQARRFWLLLGRAVLWQAITFAAAFAWYAAHTFGVQRSIGAVHLPRQLGNLEIAEAVPRRTLRWIALALAATLAVATAYTFSDLDHYVALYRHAGTYGLTEPVLQQDAGFYLARLPLLEALHVLASVSVVLAGGLVVALYALTGSVTFGGGRLRATPYAHAHLAIVLCALALVIAWGFQLSAYQLVGGGGHDAGALNAVDRAIRLPASNALALIALLTAVGSAMAARWPRLPLLLGLWATLGLSALLGRLVLPLLANAWRIGGTPEVAQALAQYADGYSRAAFGVLDAPVQNLPAPSPVEAATQGGVASVVGSVCAWCAVPGLLEAAVGSLAPDSGVPRLRSSGVAVAARGGAQERLAALVVAQTDVERLRAGRPAEWTSLHRGELAWGTGPLAVDLSPRAGPLRFLRSLGGDSAAGPTDVERSPGRVRFLARPAELALVGPDEGTVGRSPPGILLEGMGRRLLLAWALQAPPLLGRRASEADRVLYWRDLTVRLERLYPFAAFDAGRPALVRGRLLWVSDAYLASQRFPLAQRVRWHGDDVNFLASPFIATVDATSGQTRLYLRGPAQSFAVSVARSEGVDPLPADSLDPELRRELLYPSGLFGAQLAVLAKRGESPSAAWSLPDADSLVTDRDVGLLGATTALLDLDGSGREVWSLAPLTDAGGTRTTALVAATAGPNGGLRVRVLRPAGEPPTPQAAAARIGTSPIYLAALATAALPGPVRRGPVLVLPAQGHLVYVQPVFGAAEPGGPTELQGLALLVDGRVGFGPDAELAMRSLLHGDAQLGVPGGAATLAAARAAFQALDSARQRGDWAAFGRAWAGLRRSLGLEGTAERRP